MTSAATTTWTIGVNTALPSPGSGLGPLVVNDFGVVELPSESVFGEAPDVKIRLHRVDTLAHNHRLVTAGPSPFT